MAAFYPSGRGNETEPTLIADGALQDTAGAEYRVGQAGLFVARGRDLYGDLGSVTGRGLYEAGFDAGDYLVGHAGNSYHAAAIAASLTFSLVDTFASGTSEIVGCHYANRHYVANGIANRRLELVSVTDEEDKSPIGSRQSPRSILFARTLKARNMTAATG